MGKSIIETENDIVDLSAKELRVVLKLMRKQMKQMNELVKNGQIRSRSDEVDMRITLSETKVIYNILCGKLPNLYEE